jgi:hypothetical protein
MNLTLKILIVNVESFLKEMNLTGRNLTFPHIEKTGILDQVCLLWIVDKSPLSRGSPRSSETGYDHLEDRSMLPTMHERHGVEYPQGRMNWSTYNTNHISDTYSYFKNPPTTSKYLSVSSRWGI